MGASRKSRNFALSTILGLALSVTSFATDRKFGDVENIGNRDIAGRILGFIPNFVSLEKEIQIGQQVAVEFEQTAKLIEDPVVAAYIDRIGPQPLRRQGAKTPRKFTWGGSSDGQRQPLGRQPDFARSAWERRFLCAFKTLGLCG